MVVIVSSRRSAIVLGCFCPSSINSIGVILLFSQNLDSFRNLTSAVTTLLRARLSYQRLMSWFARRLSFFVILCFCFAVIVWFCSCINFFPTSDRISLRSSSVRTTESVVFTLLMIVLVGNILPVTAFVVTINHATLVVL